MNILVLGGTRFVGRHLAAELLERDHDLTLFHRGQTNLDLFPQVDRVLGDRETDLENLGDRMWDVVIDTCGYVPKQVERSVEYFADRSDRYVFISSAAVYEPTTQSGIDETAAVQTAPPASNEVEWWHSEYARNKVQCEQIVHDEFGNSNALIIRPGMVMGPYDPVNFFTYWVVRMRRGGDILAPDIRDQPLQFIDARDLATFTSEMIEQDISDVFMVNGPDEPLPFGSFLTTLQEHLESDATVHWIEEEWLLDHDVRPPWERLPYWLPGQAAEGYCRMSNEKALRYGLSVRPFTESAADVIDWYDHEIHGEHEDWVDGLPPNRGLRPTREAELLEKYFEK